MSSLPHQDDGGHPGTRARTSPVNTRGLLEDPHRVRDEFDVDIFVRNRHVACLCGRTGSTTLQSPDFSGFLYTYKMLRWTHLAALLRLEGAGPQQLLGPSVFLLAGQDRPVHAVQPGIDDVLVADLRECKLTDREVFFRIHEGLLSGEFRSPLALTAS